VSRIAGFDGIRGLGVLTVLATHLHVFSAVDAASPLWPRIIPMIHGSTGVQAFFVLSGFLITYLLVNEHAATGRISLCNFYLRRTLRIFPVYFLVVALVAVIGIWFETGINSKSFAYALLYSYNFIPREAYVPLIGHTWSIAVEEHFYLVWPLAFVLSYRKGQRRLIALLVMVIVGSHALFYSILSFTDLSANYFVNRWTPVAGGHIALGCLGALLVTTAGPVCRAVLGGPAALMLALALYASSIVPGLPDELLRPLGVGLTVVWIYLNQQSRLTRILEFRPLAYIGTISYGIYMYQGFFLSTGPYRLVYQDWPPSQPVGLMLLCVVAPLSYHYFEKPLTQSRSKLLRTRESHHGDGKSCANLAPSYPTAP